MSHTDMCLQTALFYEQPIHLYADMLNFKNLQHNKKMKSL